jgi:hypothetical protein
MGLRQGTTLVSGKSASGRCRVKGIRSIRSAGPVTQEALDAEVARITQEKLQPYGCDLVVHRTNDGIARFLIKV